MNENDSPFGDWYASPQEKSLTERIDELSTALKETDMALIDIWDTAHSAVNRMGHDPAQLNTLLIQIATAAQKARDAAKAALGGDA